MSNCLHATFSLAKLIVCAEPRQTRKLKIVDFRKNETSETLSPTESTQNGESFDVQEPRFPDMCTISVACVTPELMCLHRTSIFGS